MLDLTVFKGINDLISISGKWDTGSAWHSVAEQFFKPSPGIK